MINAAVCTWKLTQCMLKQIYYSCFIIVYNLLWNEHLADILRKLAHWQQIMKIYFKYLTLQTIKENKNRQHFASVLATVQWFNKEGKRSIRTGDSFKIKVQ